MVRYEVIMIESSVVRRCVWQISLMVQNGNIILPVSGICLRKLPLILREERRLEGLGTKY